MPVILKPEDYDVWLDPGVTDPAKVTGLLKPVDARLMAMSPQAFTLTGVERGEGVEYAQSSLMSDCRS